MAIKIAIEHHTEYRYDRRVSLGPHLIRLRPAPHSRTPVESYALRIEPSGHFINWQQDPFGNYLARVVFPDKTRVLRINVDLVADMTVYNPFDFFVEEYAEQVPFEYDPLLARDLAPYLATDEDGPLLNEWLRGVDRREANTVNFLVAINQRLQDDVAYLVRMEPGVQTCEETLQRGSGSCRDSGWLLVQIARHLGLAARFVSGYLVQLAPDIESLDGPSGPTRDFTDLHAWAEVYVPGAGWVGLDPTSGLLAGEGHIPLACTPHPVSAAPVTGEVEPAQAEFRFHNKVTRIHEDPRVTKPYTDEQWAAVDTLGTQVDEMLEAGDVRLTMGGEPTFVSIDDMDGAQWNTEALGEDKRRLAGELFRRLRARFAHGGIGTYGQGKWYPGEPLPRWALTCYWRADGEPLWRDPALLAEPRAARDAGAQEAVHDPDADAIRTFGERLARRLGLGAAFLLDAYEDPAYYLSREQKTPVNLDPEQATLDDSLERRRLARLLQGALGTPAGYVLPLAREHAHWESSAWPLRRKRLHLVPGDSPLGMRLPLDELPWVSPAERKVHPPRDPFEPRESLPPVTAPVLVASPRTPGETEPAADESPQPQDILHTALCLQVRDGVLFAFLPPLTHLEHWVELLAALEATARECAQPLCLEGYAPPDDPRLRQFAVTPDPGVIEANIHPAASWRELTSTVETLYAEARLARLGTEKFMLDGRHTGTGGGNHVTLGGPTPADSPLLRNPQLLRSLITYWQHHPALSYLFSGAFIGPTSQAPRVDEARDDNLYELEIAFQQLDHADGERPWLVDRALRNLLVDLTGNTHRAEFCIDKLYAPQGPSGRRGLLEFRAFEMPPHYRMSCLQMLLLRALVARFWRVPYREPLIRWGRALHDRFMLPHFVAQDMKAVVEDLREAGFAFEHEWFAPFMEFRFPVYGRKMVAGVELEIRWALEPWNVLGEEMAAQGTARFVDSSVERLQVRVDGMLAGRHAVTCNRRRVPLRPTARAGEFVAGVRYKAWQPPSGLHPTIGVHAPLVFDLVDERNDRSLGGCTYHVAHPGGRNYDTFPVNPMEAEARRVARFWGHGHTPGEFVVPPDPPNDEHPYTLDLRREPA